VPEPVSWERAGGGGGGVPALAASWASSGRGQLQQSCGFTAV
jgi:hypothetical protein